MKVRDGYELPEAKEASNSRAVRLEWWTIFFLITIVIVMYLTMGSSQAMKAAWLEDMLSLVPPIAFLVASRFRDREPNEKFPYGYHRSISIAFLCAALALFSMGSFMLYDAAATLLRREHPSIGTVEILGHRVWQGWVMIAALVYSAIPPVILGRMKLPLARELHDKALHADADMNKADWLTAVAGILGIAGIAAGWWWADAIAAGVISFEVLRDGFRNVRRVIEDLMDSHPTTVDGELDPAPERLERRIRELDWVDRVAVRIREEGHVFTGEVYVVPRADTTDLAARLATISRISGEVDWRLYDLVSMPVETLEGEDS